MSVELEKKLIKTRRNLIPKGTEAIFDKDIIVPDTQPDVAQVLQAEILPMICEKHLQRDYIILSGNVDYSIIYLSDEGIVKSISTRAPFTHQIEAAGAENADFAGIKADVVSVEFGAVNSRKINVKSCVNFESNIICTEEFGAVCGAAAEEELPCKTKEVSSFTLKAFAENEFEIADAVSIASGSEMIENILKVNVYPIGKEIKSISGKPVAKGVLQIKALYCDTSGAIQSTESLVPFTEVLSIDDVWDDDLIEAEYSLTDLSYNIGGDSDGDPSIIEVRARVNASACVFEQKTDTITEDMYSPYFDMSVAGATAKVSRLACSSSDSCVIKETIAIKSNCPEVAKVYNLFVKPYVENAEINGGTANISGVADTYIEYISHSPKSPVYCIKKEIPFEYSVKTDCSPNGQINVLCDADDISFTASSSDAVDVKFTLNFDTRIIEETEISYIKDAEKAENSDFDRSSFPSVVIYFAAKGEKIWDIAKRYHTTEKAICRANNCDFKNVLEEPKKILIPR